MDIDLNRFPPIPDARSKRRLYFEALDEEQLVELAARGYAPVILATMPRDTADDETTYLRAVAQGVTEGTVFLSRDRLTALRLEMEARGLLETKGASTTVRLVPSTIREFWNWDASAHSLRGNSTLEEVAKSAQEHPRRKD